jgi:hypothetical protein
VPPSEEAIATLLTWLETADLPDPPLHLIPGVEAHDVELMREQLPAAVPKGNRTALLKLRYLAARYGPPEIRELAEPEGLAKPPARRARTDDERKLKAEQAPRDALE